MRGAGFIKSVRNLAEDERGIAATEAERIRQGGAEGGPAGFADEVEGAGRVRRLHVDTGRQKPAPQRHQADDGLDRAGTAQQVADPALGAADADAAHRLTGPALNGEGFGDIVQRGAGAVGIDIIDFVRTKPGHGTGGGHAGEGGISLGMRLGEVMQVGGGAGAGDFREHRGPPRPGVVEAFQQDQAGAFTQRKAIAVGIKGPGHRGAEGLQGVESGENQLAEGIVTPAKHGGRLAAPDQTGGVGDRIGSRGTGIGNNGEGSADSECPLHYRRLLLGLIKNGPGGLAAPGWQSFVGLTVKGLPQRHAPGGGPEHDGEICQGKAGGGEGFVGGVQQEMGAAFHPQKVARGGAGRWQGGKLDFTSGGDALAGDIEQGDRPQGDLAGPEGVRVHLPTGPVSGENTGPGGHHALRRAGSISGGPISHSGIAGREDVLNTQAMERGRCQPLQQRWLEVVRAHADRPAVRLAAEGRVLTFAELHAAAAARPPAGTEVWAAGKGLPFLLEVLRAWRDDAVLRPVDAGSGASPSAVPWPEPVCHVKQTSGSTGTPREVMFTAAQLAADADQIVQTMGLRPDCPNIGVISMAHSYGFSNLVLPLLLHGIPLIVAENPLPQVLRNILAGGPAFTLPAVPAMWRAWHAAGVIDGRVRLAISAGAPLPLELERAMHQASGVKLHNFYGSSECGGIAYDRTTVPRPDARLAGTAMEGVTLAVEAASGRLTVGSAAVGMGYLEPHADLGEGMFRTPDQVRLEDGAVWLEGRASEAINVAGRKISPSRIEEKLLALPGVRHCVVFGIPSADPARVEEIAVCLNLSENTGLSEIQQASARFLPATEQPRHWRVCPGLEPDVRGKISRAAWRERWNRG